MKPSLPTGVRDFGAEQVAKRQYIINIIKKNFELFGFGPLETPTFEKLSTLTGKYGDEGDQLLFKILNSGDYIKKVSDELWAERNAKKMLPKISERGLRYDLTVPFARYVVMNQGHLTFPFKRYQIQPVWRADRPQKGRYREFYQCDADIIGTDSLLCEVELLQIIERVYSELKIEQISIKINSRKILEGIAEKINAVEQLIPMTVAIDKLDKIGLEGVEKELLKREFSTEQIEQIKTFLSIEGDKNSVLDQLTKLLSNTESGKEGIDELQTVCQYFKDSQKIKIDPTLARGLSYYTGIILEVVPIGTEMKGSVSGGGRYDDLTGNFGLANMSGVGFSFGLDRIYDVMEELNLFDEIELNKTKILFIAFNEECQQYNFEAVTALRSKGIPVEIYPESAAQVKMKKQMKYANSKKLPFVAISGMDEKDQGKFSLKNMETGEQQLVTLEEIMNLFVG